MKKTVAAIVMSCMFSIMGAAHANVFDLGTGYVNLETVVVGNKGNNGENSTHQYGYHRVCGAVNYNYRIGKYEVTTKQYTDFLNAKAKSDLYGLYNGNMWADPYGCKIERLGSNGRYTYRVSNEYANRPVNYVSFWDACRFANWLHNGQGNGNTETGAYTLSGEMSSDGRQVVRNTGWKWAVSNEDEWYKAAYYKSGSTNSGYWDYATKSNSINSSKANYDWSVGNTTNVGSYIASPSAYGTFDQCGNVWEWNETIVSQGSWYSCRGLRGGSFNVNTGYYLQANARYDYYPSEELNDVGFRVSSIPEPSAFTALVCGLIPVLSMVRRKTK